MYLCIMSKEKELRQRILKTLTESNDSVMIIMANFIDDETMDFEFAVNAEPEELFEMFIHLFENKIIRDEARKAILQSDYGREDIDSFNLN